MYSDVVSTLETIIGFVNQNVNDSVLHCFVCFFFFFAILRQEIFVVTHEVS